MILAVDPDAVKTIILSVFNWFAASKAAWQTP